VTGDSPLETDMRQIRSSDLDRTAYRDIVRLLSEGGVVCIPTDTIYGLAVDASNESAIERLYRIKGRPSEMPLILLVDSAETAHVLAEPPPDFNAIAARFWPGPITFVMPAREGVPLGARSKSGAVALRWPDSELATRLVRGLGHAITSTSANRSGRPVARSADAVARELPGVDLVVDGGPLPERRPSTLLDLTSSPPIVLREGAVSWADLSDFFGGRVKRQQS
jgi:L-threonylcarbamoyladenylate synthase